MGEILREMHQLELEFKKPPPQKVSVLQRLARKKADRAAKQGLPHAARLSAAVQAQPQPDPPSAEEGALPGRLDRGSSLVAAIVEGMFKSS